MPASAPLPDQVNVIRALTLKQPMTRKAYGAALAHAQGRLALATRHKRFGQVSVIAVFIFPVKDQIAHRRMVAGWDDRDANLVITGLNILKGVGRLGAGKISAGAAFPCITPESGVDRRPPAADFLEPGNPWANDVFMCDCQEHHRVGDGATVRNSSVQVHCHRAPPGVEFKNGFEVEAVKFLGNRRLLGLIDRC